MFFPFEPSKSGVASLFWDISSMDQIWWSFIICRCCGQFKGLWKRGSSGVVLGSYICCILDGWMDNSLPQHPFLIYFTLDMLRSVLAAGSEVWWRLTLARSASFKILGCIFALQKPPSRRAWAHPPPFTLYIYTLVNSSVEWRDYTYKLLRRGFALRSAIFKIPSHSLTLALSMGWQTFW